MTDERALLHAAQQEFLAPFVHQVFQTLNPGKTYYSNWHIDTICWHLEEVAAGRMRRLAISTPPRSLKSIISSVAFPAWTMGRNPSSRVICASYSQDLSSKNSRDFRRLVANLRYQQLFPAMKIAGGRNAENEQETSLNGFRFATSIGGTLTGRGGDVIVVDDTAKPGEALSDARRNEVNEWFGGELITRLDNPSQGAIVIVMQRLHEDDLIGHVTMAADHGWTLLNIPAIATENSEYRTGRRPEDIHLRREGDLIDPRRMTEQDLNDRRNAMGSILFNAQYQQAPIPVEGNMIHRGWIKRHDNHKPREWFDCVIQSWDTAAEAGELNDYSVCATFGIKDDVVYLLDILRRKLEFPELLRTARRWAIDHRANIVLVEKASSGNSLSQSLRSMLNCRVLSVSSRGDKQMRLLNISHMFENGTVRLPVTAPWLCVLESELLGFPSSRHDDQVDAITLALLWLKGRPPRSLRYGADGRGERPRPTRRRSGRRQPTTGPRSTPIHIFGNGGSDPL